MTSLLTSLLLDKVWVMFGFVTYNALGVQMVFHEQATRYLFAWALSTSQSTTWILNKYDTATKHNIQVILAKPRTEVSKKGEAYRKWLCHIQFNLSVILLFHWNLYFCTKRFYCHVSLAAFPGRRQSRKACLQENNEEDSRARFFLPCLSYRDIVPHLTPLAFAPPCTPIYCENTGIRTLPYFQTATLSHACHVTYFQTCTLSHTCHVSELFKCELPLAYVRLHHICISIILRKAILPCFPQYNCKKSYAQN